MEVIVEAMRQSDIILICTVMKLFCISKKYSNLLGEVRLYFFKWAKWACGDNVCVIFNGKQMAKQLSVIVDSNHCTLEHSWLTELH